MLSQAKVFLSSTSLYRTPPTKRLSRSKSSIFGLIVLIFLGVLCANTGIAEAGYIAVLNDFYEIKGRFESAQSILIVFPQVIKGDRERLGEPLLQSDHRSTLVASSLYLSGESFLRQKGYKIYTMESLPDGIVASPPLTNDVSRVWQELQGFSDAGKPIKRKMLPFRLKNLGNLKEALQKVDIMLFVQSYGDFDYDIPTEVEVSSGLVATAVVGAATGVFIAPGAGLFSPSPKYATFDYKISAIDAKSGGLVWYREGKSVDSDIRSIGKLSQSFDLIFNEYVPKARSPVSTEGKFKIKRSAIKVVSNEGGNGEEQAK